ncbi:DUF615 domain-containing protein [Allofranklinella schreckenbergeri]|uniref:Dual-action ribosomal maturation protein DarP n=1 Tax=Allofranklinella schreckenbergeri TaxID=1076744 RepID=A0A3M6R6G6_9BURK|nr:ribosome biogenesis factor YjgA [Allofranklinella schreckenbergeri]RMX10308.1 DUF615 domain-containing protein [Allofranklinella schreckenbergeri]
MSRKTRKGYFVRGQFIAEGSEEDLQFKAELKGRDTSKSDKKRESQALQALGEELLSLRSDLFDALELDEELVDALAQVRRISDFEGRRRQLQYVGKLMRRLDEAEIAAIRDALDVQRQGSAEQTQALHWAEQWRERLIADDAALAQWLQEHPDDEIQPLRALIRQARKDADAVDPASVSMGLAPRKGKAYRELFQWIQRAQQRQTTPEAPE